MTIAHFKDDKELLAFARKFFANRVETFRKDIAICLTPNETGQHAYFPALIICIAFAELLSSLYAGTIADPKLKREQLKRYAKEFMLKPEYTDDDRLDILYEFLRHKVAHLAYPYVVFDTDAKAVFRGRPRRRVTWTIHETEQRPAIKIIDYSTPRQLVRTPIPWPVWYDCRIEVSVRSLAIDIVWSIEGYLRELQTNLEAQQSFAKCMEFYFPFDPPNECPPG
jgi:hypothetical protein